MMNLEDRLSAFDNLGRRLSQYLDLKQSSPEAESLQDFLNVLRIAEQKNRWFIESNIEFALKTWAEILKYDNLKAWVNTYNFSESNLKVGVVQAGNIPLVGFHDFLSVLISGYQFVGKLSSKDEVLPVFLSDLLCSIEPRFSEYISWETNLKSVDAIIATGSDNSARYFEYYFGNKPNLIRKNRSSWAIITGKETKEELALLGEDIFRYYGLGCRNLSKIFVPDHYNFASLFEAIEDYSWVYNNNKYANNYDYNQSVYLLNQIKFLQNGFLILKEDIQHHSPLSVIFYEYYSDINTVIQRVEDSKEDIQCVCDQNLVTNLSIPFGDAQKPQLMDYADNVDTLKWLSQLSC